MYLTTFGLIVLAIYVFLAVLWHGPRWALAHGFVKVPDIPDDVMRTPTWGVLQDWHVEWTGIGFEWVRLSNSPRSDYYKETWSPSRGYRRNEVCYGLEGF